jgi:hypothetical protein
MKACPVANCHFTTSKKKEMVRHVTSSKMTSCSDAQISINCCGETFVKGWQLGVHLQDSEKSRLKEHNFVQISASNILMLHEDAENYEVIYIENIIFTFKLILIIC